MTTETNHFEFDRELLSAYVDGELSGAERAAVEARLASDPAAQRQVEEFRRLSGLIQNLPQPTLPADFSAKVMLRAEQARPAAPSEPLRPGISIGRTWRSWAWPGLAIAAALLIAVMLPNRDPELADRRADTSSPAVKEVPELRSSGDSSAVVSNAPHSGLELPRSEERAAAQADASGRPSASDSLATDALPPSDGAFDSRADEPRLLIVRVSMPAGALERRALDQVLAKNGIDVEPAEESAPTREEEVVDRARELALGRPAAKSDTAAPLAGVGGEAAKAERAIGQGDMAPPTEVVLVDAPIEQITASLASIEGDTENFHALEIEETSPLLKQKAPLVNGEPDQWRQFNRALTADRESLLRDSAVDGPTSAADAVASDETSPAVGELSTLSQKAENSSSPADILPPGAPAEAAPASAPAVVASPRGLSEPRVLLKAQEKLVERGRAYRYLSTDDKKLRLDALARRRGQLHEDKDRAASRFGGGGASAADSRLRVLFVLQETLPAPAAPAAVKAAEPTKPPR